jgi:hypothetical protein
VNTQQTEYELVLRGRISSRMRRSLERFEVTSSGPDATHLRGWLPDQAALHGVLEQIRDLGLVLDEVRRVS